MLARYGKPVPGRISQAFNAEIMIRQQEASQSFAVSRDDNQGQVMASTAGYEAEGLISRLQAITKQNRATTSPNTSPSYSLVQPYPLNANWELPHDYITFGRWIAGCIGPDPFFALFYKPSARGQVLIEVNRNYPHPERLLGEHRWSEFLKRPTEEEAGRVSQIFYRVYSTGRQAQKDGWKRINVADSWFKNWSPVNPVIQNPYPTTSWCPLPPEDRTNKPMCRPLPVSVKPPPPPKAGPAPIVPGSATWASAKTAPSTNTPAALRGQWAARVGAAVTTATAKNNAAAVGSSKTAKAIPATSAAPWHTATAPKSSNVVPAAPPGLGLGLNANPTSFPAPPGLVRGGGGSSTHTSASSASSAGAMLPVIADPRNDFVRISLSPSQEKRLYAAADGDEETSPDPNAYVAEWEKMPEATFVGLWADSGVYTGGGFKAQKEEVVESLWGADDEDDSARMNKKPADSLLCSVHGIICKKGICKEYSKMLRDKERSEKEKERKGSWNKTSNNNNKKNGGGGWKKKGTGWKDDESGSATGSEGRPCNEGWSTLRGR
ncbi:hypothetical protein C8R43DRAFT_1137074 [Mycena crocata]|nr:hypothetical protein C8R43DRAFT_1137074 [Mycena crocata]